MGGSWKAPSRYRDRYRDAESPRKALVVGAVVLGVVACLFTAAAWGLWLHGVIADSRSSVGVDYRAFAAAGGLFTERNGAAIYEGGLSIFASARTSLFLYPPWFALVVVPLTVMPPVSGYLVWTATGVTMAVGSMALLYGRAGAMIGVVAVGSLAGLLTVHYGQSEFLLVTLIAGLTWSLSRRHDTTAGVLVALIAFKPHLLVGILVVFLARPARFKRVIVAAVSVTASLYVVAELWIPGVTMSWVRAALGAGTNRVAPSSEVTIPAALELLFHPNVPGLALRALTLVAGIVVLVAMSRRDRLDLDVQLFVAFVVTLVVSPHALRYDIVILAPIAAAIWVGHEAIRRRLLAVLSALVVLSTIDALIIGPQLDIGSRAIAMTPWLLAGAAVVVVHAVEAVGVRDVEIRLTPLQRPAVVPETPRQGSVLAVALFPLGD